MHPFRTEENKAWNYYYLALFANQLKGSVSRDGYLFESLKILISDGELMGACLQITSKKLKIKEPKNCDFK
jgi:hypothetical protein